MITFINYTGKWPNLCSGVLTVEIDCKEIKFGHEINDYDFKTNSYKTDNFEKISKDGANKIVELTDVLNNRYDDLQNRIEFEGI